MEAVFFRGMAAQEVILTAPTRRQDLEIRAALSLTEQSEAG